MGIDLAVTRVRGVVRLHRITCKRLRPGQAAPLALVAPVLVLQAVPASCCKPRAAALDARRTALQVLSAAVMPACLQVLSAAVMPACQDDA